MMLHLMPSAVASATCTLTPLDAARPERPAPRRDLPLLELRGVTRTWLAGMDGCAATVRALAAVDLSLRAGELVALAGRAGAGKTTLLLCAAGLVRPDAGCVTGAAAGRVAYVGAAPTGWARRATAAMERGARVLLLDVMDDASGAPGASPREAAALAGSATAAGLAVVVVARELARLPAFATRLVAMDAGRITTTYDPVRLAGTRRARRAPGARDVQGA